jgi:hypothetical protein
MIEKIVLTIAITFSLYSIVQIKPPQRAVAIDINFRQGTLNEFQSPVRILAKI